MSWCVAVNLKNGQEHTIVCESYRDAASIQSDIRDMMLLGIIDQEALTQFNSRDFVFKTNYKSHFIPDTNEQFVVNPCEISSISLWEVEEE